MNSTARRGVVLLVLLSLGHVACTDNVVDESSGSGGPNLVCEMTDGEIDDKSFNATAHQGVIRAESRLEVDTELQAGLQPDIAAFIGDRCHIILSIGYRLAEATLNAADQSPGQRFAIVDFWFDFGAGEDLTRDNVRVLAYQSDQATFLAGYLAAGMSRTHKVATFGGLNIPTVTLAMDGFLAGVRAYSQDTRVPVRLLGWDGRNGTFSGDSFDQDRGYEIAEDLIGRGADIILPVAGAAGLGAAAAAHDAGDVLMIGVDTDQFKTTPEYADQWLTSVEKNMDVAVFETIESVVADDFQGGLYVGTLENGGVGLAPYHNLEGMVPVQLKEKLKELRGGIIDGWVSVDPDDYIKNAPHGQKEHGEKQPHHD